MITPMTTLLDYDLALTISYSEIGWQIQAYNSDESLTRTESMMCTSLLRTDCDAT